MTMMTETTCHFCSNDAPKLIIFNSADPRLDDFPQYRLCVDHKCSKCDDVVIESFNRKKRTRKDLSALCLTHVQQHEDENKRKKMCKDMKKMSDVLAADTSASSSQLQVSLTTLPEGPLGRQVRNSRLYITGRPADVFGKTVQFQAGLVQINLILPDHVKVPGMAERRNEIEELVENATGNRVKFCNSGMNLAAMLSSFSENVAIHQTLPLRARPIENYLIKLVDLHPDPALIEQCRTEQTACMSETFSGIPNRLFPYPFDDPALAEDIRVKAIIQTPETRSCLQGIQTEIQQCEGSTTLSTAGYLQRITSDFALDIFLLSGTQIYFIANERVILMNAGDRLIIRPNTPFAVYTIDHSLSVERALFSPQHFPLPNLVNINSLSTVYACLMAIGGSEGTDTYMNALESLLPEGNLAEVTPDDKIAQVTVDLYRLWDSQRKLKQEK